MGRITSVRVGGRFGGRGVALLTRGVGVAAAVWASAGALAGDLRAAVDGVREKYRVPGLGAAIVRDGKLVGAAVSGVRVLKGADAVTMEDRWPIGSCSKNAARLVMARLNERGELRFDATVGEVFAGAAVRAEYVPVTVVDLLAHRGGIRAYEQIGPRITPEVFDVTGTPTEQRARFAMHVLGLEPAAPPRTRFVYSNAGFCVVAAMAERATGKSWDVLVKDEVFAPLGLGSAVVGVDPLGALRGHVREGDGLTPVRQVRGRLAVMEPAGGLCMRIADFAKFAAAEAELAAARPVAGLTEKTLKRLPELRPADMPGNATPGEAFYGGDGQFSAAFAVWPEQHVGIAVATNSGEGDDACTAAIEAVREALAKDLVRGGEERAEAGAPAAAEVRFGFSIRAEEGGMVVAEVAAGSIAERAGLKADDVIVSMNGEKVEEMEHERLMGMVKAKKLRVEVERGGKREVIEMKK